MSIRRAAVKAAVVYKYRKNTREKNIRMSIQDTLIDFLQEEEKENE